MSTSRQNTGWNVVFWLGGAAALGAVLVGVVEILITFLPSGNVDLVTAREWLLFFQDCSFMALRNLGLLNILLNLLAILTYLGFFGAHRDNDWMPLAALALILALLGSGIFLATNRAFAMLGLSQLYASAGSAQEKVILEGAGQSLLAVGGSHTPGTFLGFFLAESAGLLASYVMLRSGIFSRTAGYFGMVGFGILLIYELLSSFAAGLQDWLMALAGIGGLASMVWYLLTARTLFGLKADGQPPYPK